MINQRGPVDVRRVFTGKDAVLFSEDGTMLATVESYQGQVNITNATYQPLGDAQQHEAFQAYKVSLTITECVIEDNQMITDLFEMLQSGQGAKWTFQGVLKGRDGSEERMLFRDCVPSGNIDLQNMNVGDIIKRSWNLTVNRPPELQNLLTYTS